MTEQHNSDSAEAFDPVAFAERWYEEVWPVQFPAEFNHYILALKSLGKLGE